MKKVILKSSDGESFEVDEAVALESHTIKQTVEEDCPSENGIPLPNVTGRILAKVIEYCKKHVDAADSEDKISDDDLKSWDAEFVKVDKATLFDLILVSYSNSFLFFFAFHVLLVSDLSIFGVASFLWRKILICDD